MPEELTHMSEDDREHYIQQTEAKFNAIMDGNRLRIQLAEALLENRQKSKKSGPGIQLKSTGSHFGNHTVIAELDRRTRQDLHEAKRLIGF